MASVSSDCVAPALPAGLRSTRATRAVLALFAAQPDLAWSESDMEAALATQGVRINRVTVYRLLDRLAQAGLLRRSVDAARVTRYVRAGASEVGSAAHFECEGCHRQFRLAGACAALQAALRELADTLAQSGHQQSGVNIALRGRCAGCASGGQGQGAAP